MSKYTAHDMQFECLMGEKEKVMDHETIHCIEVASDMSGVRLPDGYKNMTWSQFVDSVKFISKEQEDLFVTYYLK